MNDFFRMLARLLARCVLLLAGLVMAASLAVIVLLLASAWIAYAGWARLTGRRVAPFVMRMNPRAGFARAWRRSAAAQESSRTPRADATRGSPGARPRTAAAPASEVIDVEARL